MILKLIMPAGGILASVLLAAPALAYTGFDLDNVPPGAQITLPQPATTVVSTEQPVYVTPTDSPQTLRITPVDREGKEITKFDTITVSIFDRRQDRVRHVKLRSGLDVLYQFTGPDAITITTIKKASGRTAPSTLKLRLESDKPLGVQR